MTFNPTELMREDLQDIKPYQPHDYPDTIKLDANENPYPFPQEALEEIKNRLEKVNFPLYPDPMAVELRHSISRYVGVRPEQVIVGNGSDELIFYLAQAFGSGGNLVISSPTFSMYRIHSQIAGAEAVELPREEDFGVNPRVLAKAVQAAKARLLVLCSPNNPTGNATSLEVIEEILASTNAVVVVDQAYLEFGGVDCTPLLDKYPNLVILRTFSKAFGLAGLRVGYMLASEQLINDLLRIKQPYNLNSFSQMAAGVALEYLPTFKEQWQQIIANRDYIIKAISQLPGVEVFPTDANYILFRTDMDAGEVHQKLLGQKILVRNLGSDLAGYLRVNAGTKEESEAFVKALSNAVNEVK